MDRAHPLAGLPRPIWPLLCLLCALASGLGLSRLGCVERLEEGINARALQATAVRQRPASNIVLVDLGQEFLQEGGYAWSAEADRRQSCQELVEGLQPLLSRVGPGPPGAAWNTACPTVAAEIRENLALSAAAVVETREKKCADLAVAIDRLFLLGAKVVVLDLLLGPKPSALMPKEATEEERSTHCGRLGRDWPLYQVLSKYRSQLVLASFLDLPATARTWTEARAVVRPARILTELPGMQLGLVNLALSEGVAQRMPSCLRGPDGATHCGLGVVAAHRYAGLPLPGPTVDELRFRGHRFHLLDGQLSYALHRFPSFVPLHNLTGSDQTFRANPRRLESLRKRLSGALVFVGPRNPSLTRNDDQVSGDLWPTPYGGVHRYLSGVEIHAQVAATLLSGRGLSPLAPPLYGMTLLLLVLGAFVLGRYLGLAWAPLAGGAWLCLCGIGTLWARYTPEIFFPLVGPQASGGLALILGMGLRFAVISRTRLKLWLALRHQLSRSGMEEVLRDPQSLAQADTLQEVTVLFSDIRGFSSLSEKLRPPEIVVQLREWLGAATECLTAERGYLENYLGDGFMALFGAPLRVPTGEDQVANACRAAQAMVSVLARLNDEWTRQGRPRLAIGIGINTGLALAGDMGTSMRFHYTAVGDCINLGSRIEGLNKMYGTTILVGRRPYELGQSILGFREIDWVRVKGREEPETIYELLGADRASSDPGYEAYALGLAAYRRADLAAAREAFAACLAEHSEDGPSRTFLARLDEMAADPPAPGWDGVYTAKTK